MKPLNPEHAKAREEAWLEWSEGLPAEVLPEARKAWEKTSRASVIDLRHAMLDLTEAVGRIFRKGRK